MKNRSIQAISIGLSALTLAGPASMTMYVHAAEEAKEPETNTQATDDRSEEEDIAREISNLSEQLNTSTSTDALNEAASEEGSEGQFEQQVSEIAEDESAAKNAVDSLSAPSDNLVKSQEAVTEAQRQAQDAVNQANSKTDLVKETTDNAGKQAQGAVNVLKDENTVKEDAATIIANTDKTVEEAQLAFDSAENKYNEAFEAYTSAKDDFDVALNAYNSNKQQMSSGLEDAKKALESAQVRLNELEKQLESARNDLAAAGADALLTKEQERKEHKRGSGIESYVSAILQYYYVPNAEKLSEGESVSDFKVIRDEEDASHLIVSYEITDSEGNSLRTVNADYGYTISPKDGEIQLFTRDLSYQYTNASGQTVTITKEEAEELNGEVMIDNYWSIEGYYVPIYKDFMRYEGTRYLSFSPQEAIRAGKQYVINLYKNDKDKYKQVIEFGDDWYCNYNLIEFNTTGTFTAIYCKVSDLPGYTVSSDIAEARFATEEEANAAVLRQAKREQKAYAIDDESSRLYTRHHEEYAKIVKKYINVGDAVWKSTAKDYTAYLSSVQAKITAYDNLLSTVAVAKADFNAAQDRVMSIQERLNNLNEEVDIVSVAEMVRLEAQLKAAESDYSIARENLQVAKASLSEAKALYNERFLTSVPVIQNTSEAAKQLQKLEEEVEEALEDETLQELPEEMPELTDAQSSEGHDGSSRVNVYPEQIEPELDEETPVSPEEIIIATEEETPKGITLAGVLQHAKWFAGLAGVSAAGAGVGVFEMKRRAAAKIIDKLNQ